MKPAIDIRTERQRVEVEKRHRQLSAVAVRYLSQAEREELRRCNAWLKKHARGWEK